MEWKTEVILEHLTQEISDLQEKSSLINSPKQLGAVLFEEFGAPLEYTKKTKTGYSTAVDVFERLAQLRSYLKFGIRQLLDPIDCHKIGFWKMGRSYHYVQDLTQTGHARVWIPACKSTFLSVWSKGRLIHRPLSQKGKRSVFAQFGLFTDRIARLNHISGDEHLIDAFKHGADIQPIDLLARR